MSQEILKKIHNVDPWIKVLPDRVVYRIAQIILIVFLLSPYWLRIFWAFLLNILLNSPLIYINMFTAKIGKRINAVVLSIFYLTFFAIYALAYKMIIKYRKNRGWIPVNTGKGELPF